MWPNPLFPADLVTFTEEILHGKLHFLWSETSGQVSKMNFFAGIIITLSWRRPLSNRNQSIDLLCKSMDWFLYDKGLRHERVNGLKLMLLTTFLQKVSL